MLMAGKELKHVGWRSLDRNQGRTALLHRVKLKHVVTKCKIIFKLLLAKLVKPVI